jgi:hypothetical protein
MRRILFVTYGAGHVAMCLPVIQALRARADLDVKVLGLTTAQAALRARGIPHLGFRDFVTDETSLACGQRLVAALPGAPVDPAESMAYLGASYADLVDTHGSATAAALYEERGRQAFLPVGRLRQIITDVAPDLVVATNSPRAERAAIVAAGQLGIPALCLVDLFALQEVAWIGNPGYARRVCVLSEFVRQIMIRSGRRPDEVVVTGNPAFDSIAAPDLGARGLQIRSEQGWGSHKVILWASQVEPERHPFTGQPGDPLLPRQIEGEMVRAVASHADWQGVIRYHPSEGQINAPRAARISVSPRQQDLHALLHAVDVVAVMSSTVGLEAALIGRPVVALGMSVFSSDAPYAQMGLALGVDRIQDFPRALEVALSGNWRPSGELPPVGTATDAVVREIGLLL